MDEKESRRRLGNQCPRQLGAGRDALAALVRLTEGMTVIGADGDGRLVRALPAGVVRGFPGSLRAEIGRAR